MAAAASAHAQAPVKLSTQVAARRVEVGQAFRLQLTALSEADGDTPSSARLTVPKSIASQGPSVSTQRQVSIVGGRIEQRQGITATWTLRASRAGQFTLGPASVVVGGRRVTGERVTVEVVPAGSGAPGRRRGMGWPFDPFDPFRSFPGMPPMPGFGQDDQLSEEDLLDSLPPFPEELRSETAPDQLAFLRATVEPESAVVGQQMTLRVYAYGRRGPFREVNASEPSRPDFLSHVIIENSYGRRLHRVPIAGEVWQAVKIREVALFPIRAGTLQIGAMRMGFDGRGYPSGGQMKGLVRHSNSLQVTVSEPPLVGRPPGYQLGDVGQFSLSAAVQPREVKVGEAVSVVVTLRGRGNLPQTLRTPGQRGVEWLEPSVVEDIQVESSGLSGWRKFTYVVRLDEPGRVRLGEVRLPYWDPWDNAYHVARTGLGIVEVRGEPTATGEQSDEPVDPLEQLTQPRTQLGTGPQQPWRPADRPWFWAVLAFGPTSVLVLRAGGRLGRSLRRRWRERQLAHQAVAVRALRQAGEAARNGDVGSTASQVERALFTALEGAVGLRARAVLREELTARLQSSGLSEELAHQAVALLEDADAVRFTGDEPKLSASELVRRAEALVERLGRIRPSKPPPRGDT